MVRSYKEWIRIRLIAIVSSLKITDNITERRLGVALYTYSQHRKIAHCTKTICQHLSIPNLHITFDKSNWEDHTTVQDTTVPFHVQLVWRTAYAANTHNQHQCIQVHVKLMTLVIHAQAHQRYGTSGRNSQHVIQILSVAPMHMFTWNNRKTLVQSHTHTGSRGIMVIQLYSRTQAQDHVE